MKRPTLYIGLACASAIIWLTASIGAAQAEPSKWEDYQILVRRNIFSRNRGATRLPSGPATPATPPPPEHFVLLRGTVKQGEEFTAVFENMRSGEVLRRKAGEALLDGTVERVENGKVIYSRGEENVVVGMGENLEKSGTSQETLLSTGGTTNPSSSVSAPASQAEMLERLKQRRLKELGR